MLVLARKLDEAIVLGDDITVKIISIDKGVVKLGIDAPKSVSILRSELIEDVKDANIAASKESDTNIIGQKEVPFSISRMKRQEVSYEGMPYYEEIEYFLDPRDYKEFKKLPKEGKKAFLDRFWRTMNYYEIAGRFEYVEEHFRHGDTPGHKTDRGRIYIKYGQPEDIEYPLPLEHQESRPYEHWQYTNGEQFIFVDLRGANNYILVWTNALDERSQPTLYKHLPPEKQELIH